MSRAFDVARAHAVAKDQVVWVDFEREESEGRDLVMRFRTATADGSSTREFRRSQRFRDVVIDGSGSDPVETGSSEGPGGVPLGAEDSLRFTPGGQVYPVTAGAETGNSGATLRRRIDVVVQATRDGRVVPSVEADRAVIGLHGATATSEVEEP